MMSNTKTTNRRIQTLTNHLTAANFPDINVPKSIYAHDRMSEEATTHIISKLMHDAERPYFPDPINDWGTVTRGNPPAHLLPANELPAAHLTPSTWFCDVQSDHFVDPPYVRSPCTVETSLKLDLPSLIQLGKKFGTIKVMKAMQCLNVDSPLGQGVWEGVRLSTILKQCCGDIENCRRLYYWGYHNNDLKQIFRSSISYTECFENVPNEPPIFLAYKLNGKPLPLIRGGPVRMIVPHAHGFKNVKFLQHIRLSNDYRINDTYAAIDEGNEGNDPSSIQKTYTTIDQRMGSEPIHLGHEIEISGVLMNGRTPCHHLEYWIRSLDVGAVEFTKLGDLDEELLNGNRVAFDLPKAPLNLNDNLPNGILAKEVFGVNGNGVPKVWPLPFSYVQWKVSLKGVLKVGSYEIRARAVDVMGNKQPEPRISKKSGRNSIGVRRLKIV